MAPKRNTPTNICIKNLKISFAVGLKYMELCITNCEKLHMLPQFSVSFCDLAKRNGPSAPRELRPS
jgi:hypothetical protein